MSGEKDPLVIYDGVRAWSAARRSLVVDEIHKQLVEHYLRGRLTIEEAARLQAEVHHEYFLESFSGGELQK
jgi:hypothetical protein